MDHTYMVINNKGKRELIDADTEEHALRVAANNLPLVITKIKGHTVGVNLEKRFAVMII